MQRLAMGLNVGVWLAGTLCHTQDDGKIACYNYPRTTESYKKKLWDGYQISLGPARNAQGGGDDQCTAAIYNAAGRVVFRTTGFGVIFDEDHTGEDFDGDGKPEVVFMTDEAGGAHCCWIYNVISLWPKPHKLFDVGAGAAVNFAKDKDGKTIIWERVGGTTEYTGGVDAPFAERVYRVQGGKLVDATPDFCGKILSPGSEDYDVWTRVLTPLNIANLKSTKKVAIGEDPKVEETVSALLSRAQQHVLCHQYDDAMADLNLWPEATRDEMKHNFADSIKSYSPEFAARLAGPSVAK
ncbi:MAG: hypothetical protein WA350_19890 [Candidatus Sulfotelmatobacter sp.]|jgi:hypothetical protein